MAWIPVTVNEFEGYFCCYKSQNALCGPSTFAELVVFWRLHIKFGALDFRTKPNDSAQFDQDQAADHPQESLYPSWESGNVQSQVASLSSADNLHFPPRASTLCNDLLASHSCACQTINPSANTVNINIVNNVTCNADHHRISSADSENTEYEINVNNVSQWLYL